MPFEIVWEPHGAYRKFYGFVTAPEFKRSIERLHNDLHFDTLKYVINDFLEVQGHEIAEADITMFAALWVGASFSNPNVRIATVSTDEKIMALMQDYASFHLKPSHLGNFSGVADARKWIAVEISQFWRRRNTKPDEKFFIIQAN